MPINNSYPDKKISWSKQFSLQLLFSMIIILIIENMQASSSKTLLLSTQEIFLIFMILTNVPYLKQRKQLCQFVIFSLQEFEFHHNYKIQMRERLILTLLLLGIAISSQVPVLLLNSSHTHNSFQVTFSIASDISLKFYSKRIVKSNNHWASIDTHTIPASIVPPFQSENLLVNTLHDNTNFLHYFQTTHLNDLNRHFHYAQSEYQGKNTGYLLPSFASMVPGFRVDKIFKCSKTIVSVEWIEDSAHIVLFSEEDNWMIQENIDGGFRSSERQIEYGYAIDYGHIHPVKIEIGDHQYCEITRETKPANIDFKWQVRENYELNDVLYLAGESLPIKSNAPIPEQL